MSLTGIPNLGRAMATQATDIDPENIIRAADGGVSPGTAVLSAAADTRLGTIYGVGGHSRTGTLRVPQVLTGDDEGVISLPLIYLIASIAASPAFQEWVDADDAAEAAEHVFTVAGSNYTLPLAIVDWAKPFMRQKSSAGVVDAFETAADLRLWFRAAIDAEEDDSDAARTFLDMVGVIMGEVESLSGQEGYLAFDSWTIVEGPYRPQLPEGQTVGHFYEIELGISTRGEK